MFGTMLEAGLVHVVDDDPAVRTTIRLLCSSIGIDVREYGTIAELNAAGPLEPPSCIVLDLRLPRLGGLPGLAELRARHPQVPIVVVSGHADVRIAAQAMKLGAWDMFPKPFASQELLDSLQKAIAQSGASNVDTELQLRIALLSRRQKEIVGRLARGANEEQVATDMGLHLKSVQRHRRAALETLRIRRGDEAALLGLFD